MTILPNRPAHWDTFRRAINAEAPAFPLPAPDPTVERIDQANRSITFITTILSASGVPVPSMVDYASAVAGTHSPSDLANSGIDIVAGRAVESFVGAGGGIAPVMIVGNGINVLRGALQALIRTDEMADFLQQIIAYCQTLARTAILATRESVPYVRLPEPIVPADMEASGSVYNGRLRGGYIRGYNRVNTVIREVDVLRPISGDWYSKRNFLHLYLQGNPGLALPQDPSHSWRVRARIEAYVVGHILGRDLANERERLRRWAMSG